MKRKAMFCGVRGESKAAEGCRTPRRLIGLMTFLMAGSVCGAAESPNVLLIVSEDNGAELGCYGEPHVRTPHLDRLAADGVRFANAYVTHAVCSASRASFYTGLYPFQNGQIGLATHRYSMFEEWDSLPSVLKEHGYRTGIIGKLHVNPESAFPFDYEAVTGSGFNDRPMEKYAAATAAFFNEGDPSTPSTPSTGSGQASSGQASSGQASSGQGKPFFLALNFPDAHFPLLRQEYGLPEEPLTAAEIEKPLGFIGADSERLRKGTADYYNCLMRLDSGIGMVLEELEKAGKAEDTLVIYIGDHGAQFSRGKGTCYEGGLRIPMMMRWPGQVKAGTVREELVSTVDILPTVIQAVGLPARASLPGRSLLPLAADREVTWREYLYAERTAFHAGSFFPQRTMRDDRYKVIVNLTPERENPVADRYRDHDGVFFIYGTEAEEIDAAPEAVREAYARWKNPPPVELYDLEADPWEFVDLSGDTKLAPVKERLLGALQAFREEHGDPLLDGEKLAKLAAEHDHVNTEVKGGRYGKDQSWGYLKYLRGEEESATAGPPVTMVFSPKEDGYPHIRIPAMVTTQAGTLLAFAEGRQGGDHSENDIILKRSEDGGKTWGPLQVVHEEGANVMANPCVAVLASGRIVMMFQRYPAGYHARALGDRVKRTEPGLSGPTVSTTLVCHSDDDGKTWSAPRDVTAQAKRGAPVVSTAAGPGVGIVLTRGKHAGRIVMPTNEGWYEEDGRHFNVYACYSDDDGETWRTGQPAPNGKEPGQGNEVQMVELADGSVMLNTRSNGGTRHRKVAISEDGGETWSALRDEPAHPESQCMGTIVRQAWPEGGKDGVLVFANPANQKGRSKGTIRLSFDEGKTWPVSRLVHEGGYAYSCLAPMGDGSVGLLYEADGYKRIDFVRVTMDWVKGEEKSN